MMNILDSLATRLGDACRTTRDKIVTAESCTGGGLAEAITRIPGSSEWFERGFVCYSNSAKREQLHVPEDTIRQYGAVSEETALAMARGALEHSHATLAVAITGIAGPDGGSDEKPVGTVCFTWAEQRTQSIRTATARFDGDRRAVRTQACMFALQGLIEILERIRA